MSETTAGPPVDWMQEIKGYFLDLKSEFTSVETSVSQLQDRVQQVEVRQEQHGASLAMVREEFSTGLARVQEELGTSLARVQDEFGTGLARVHEEFGTSLARVEQRQEELSVDLKRSEQGQKRLNAKLTKMQEGVARLEETQRQSEDWQSTQDSRLDAIRADLVDLAQRGRFLEGVSLENINLINGINEVIGRSSRPRVSLSNIAGGPIVVHSWIDPTSGIHQRINSTDDKIANLEHRLKTFAIRLNGLTSCECLGDKVDGSKGKCDIFLLLVPQPTCSCRKPVCVSWRIFGRRFSSHVHTVCPSPLYKLISPSDFFFSFLQIIF